MKYQMMILPWEVEFRIAKWGVVIPAFNPLFPLFLLFATFSSIMMYNTSFKNLCESHLRLGKVVSGLIIVLITKKSSIFHPELD